MSNSNAIYNLNGVPLFTYGMIGITTVVLAVVTMMDTDNDSFAKDEGYEKSETESNKSIVQNILGLEKEKEEEQDEDVENVIVDNKTEELKKGGKYGNRKTKHNKRQNTYTRKK